jgi:uncharacterized protein DUF6049
VTRWKTGAGLLTTALLALGPMAGPAVSDAAAVGKAGAAHESARTVGQPQPSCTTQYLSLEIDSLTPRVVTSATPKLTVTGRINNTGDRRVDDVQVRVQRGEPVETDGQLRDLAELDTVTATSEFVDVADSLDRGDSTSFKVTVPLRGGDQQSLALAQPGVYPALVNVNGQPEYGDRARLACASLPLPALSIPGGKTAKRKAAPPDLTFLWPIMDTQPRRLPTTDGQVVLTDDDLANSLSVGGRLFGLVNSASVADAASGELLNSMCFAIDPDLLQTVDAMTRPYKVQTAGGRLVTGKGEDAAKAWLTQLRDLTRGQCVIAVPYSDADLVALSRSSGAHDLTTLAVSSSEFVGKLLAPVEPVKGLYWPAGGTLDQRAIVDLSTPAPATVLADPGHLRGVHGKAPYELVGLQTVHPVRAVSTDPLLSRTLAPAPGGGSLQSGLASLAFRAVFDKRAGEQVIIAPPRRWTASGSELTTYLGLAQRLFAGGYATPRSLTEATTGASGGSTVGLSYTPQDSVHEVPRSVTVNVVRLDAMERDLLKAMVEDATNTVDSNQLLSPLQYGLLRGVSATWRGHPDKATAWVEYVDQQMAALRGKVVVRDPGRPITLASGDSPVPVNVRNNLPVAIVVRVRLAATSGLRPEKFTDIRIPPQNSRSPYIPSQVIRAGRFTVDASLTTPGGTKLGSTARLELTSTSYGFVTVAITAVAGGILLLLVVIRLVRRVRGAQAGKPEDETGTDTGPQRPDGVAVDA